MAETLERRSTRFTERLSLTVIAVAALGGFIVLLDPVISGRVWGFEWKLGTGDFSAELKGAVVTIMLIGGWTAVVSFWIGATKGDEQKSATLSRIAESVPEAARVAANGGLAPHSTAAPVAKMDVKAEQVNVTEQPPKENQP